MQRHKPLMTFTTKHFEVNIYKKFQLVRLVAFPHKLQRNTISVHVGVKTPDGGERLHLIGFAIHNPTDKYDEAVGMRIAFTRALYGLQKSERRELWHGLGELTGWIVPPEKKKKAEVPIKATHSNATIDFVESPDATIMTITIDKRSKKDGK